MRIGLLVTSFPSVSQTFVLQQITGLLDRGHEVEIIASRRGEGSVQHEDVERYALSSRVHYRPAMPAWMPLRLAKLGGLYAGELSRRPGRIPAFIRMVWQNRSSHPVGALYHGWTLLGRSYDVLHCQFGSVGRAAAMLRAAGLIQAPILTTFHGFDLNAYPRRHGAGCYRTLFEKGDLFTISSEFARQRLLRLGAPAERVVEWPMGIDVDQFPFAERRRQEGEAVRLLTVARLVEVKGLQVGIEAVARLVRSGKKVHYRIIGEGPLRTKLEARVRELGLEEVVSMPGAASHDQVKKELIRAHIFVLPGVTASDGAVETQGVVLLEAQATGLPVVASNCGGIPESILPGKSGGLVPERDAGALADQLSRLIDSPERWPEMGRAGRAYVEEKYNLPILLDELVDMYLSLLQK